MVLRLVLEATDNINFASYRAVSGIVMLEVIAVNIFCICDLISLTASSNFSSAALQLVERKFLLLIFSEEVFVVVSASVIEILALSKIPVPR